MADLSLAARLVLAAVFAVSALTKLMDRDAVGQAIRAFGVPHRLGAPLAAVLPIAEAAVAVGLLVSATAVAGAAGALALLVVFMVGIAVSMARGHPPDCRCFGQLHAAPVGWPTLARDAALAGAAIAVLAVGPGTGLGGVVSGLSGLDWAMLAVAITIAVAFVVEGSALLRHHRRKRTFPSRRHWE